jgi:hypothetical protein
MMEKLSEATIAELMGHSDPQTTRRYTNATDRAKRAAVEGVSVLRKEICHSARTAAHRYQEREGACWAFYRLSSGVMISINCLAFTTAFSHASKENAVCFLLPGSRHWQLPRILRSYCREGRARGTSVAVRRSRVQASRIEDYPPISPITQIKCRQQEQER